MASSSKHALPEYWTELNSARTSKARSAELVNTIKTTCAAQHGKAHISECKECLPKVLDTMYSRYCNSDGREWFSQRRAFIKELELLFADAKERKVDLQAIEARIESEKEAWYRWVLRTYPEFLAVAGTGVNQDELRSMLDDPDKSRQELIDRIGEGLGQESDSASQVDSFAEKVKATEGNPAQLKELYISQFFARLTTDEAKQSAQKYLELYEASENLTMEDVIDKIAQDHRDSISYEPQRKEHEERLVQLRRAKTAFEQNRMQAKIRRQEAQNPTVPDEFYSLPLCEVCQEPVINENVVACSVCQVFHNLGGKMDLTVYCSDKCYDHGQVSVPRPQHYLQWLLTQRQELHVERYHDCVARDNCAQYNNSIPEADLDVSKPICCRKCVEHKQATIFCSPPCAQMHLPRHMYDRHGVQLAAGETKAMMYPFLELAGKTVKEKTPGLNVKLGASART
ncbi:hypothetical protein G7046_g8784 [Stylonectria norvegica]|nr:hypothetical protein G7046_g8784 [Stylonectria norvegica]